MKRMLLCLFALLAFAAQATFAQAYDNRLETIDQARQRQSAERWNEYQHVPRGLQHGYFRPITKIGLGRGVGGGACQEVGSLLRYVSF